MRFKRVTSFDDWPTDNPEKMKEMLRKPHLAFMPYVGGPSAKDDDIVMLSPRSTKTGPVTIVEYDVDDLGSIVYVNDYAVQAAAIFFRAGRNIINVHNHDVMGKTFFDFHYGDDGLMMIADGELSEGQTHQLMLIDPDGWEFSKMWEDTQYEPITAHGNQDLRKILDDFEKTGSVPGGSGNNWIFNPQSTRRWPGIILEGSNEAVLALDARSVEMMLGSLDDVQGYHAAINRRPL